MNHQGLSHHHGISDDFHRGSLVSPVLAGACVLMATAVGLWPAFSMLAKSWSDGDTYSHGYLVGLISVYLLYLALTRPSHQSTPMPVALVLLVIGLAVWCLGYVADVETVMWLLLPPILALSFIAVLGWGAAKKTLFPLSFLYFAIPLWNYIIGVLQSGTVLVVEQILNVLGITALFEGSRVLLSSGTFEIAGGCGGTNFFVVSLALATLYSYLYLRTWGSRIVLGLVAAGLALLTNWVRVATIIYAGDATAMQHFLVSVDHIYFGWALFGLSLIPFFMVAGKLRPPLDQAGAVRTELANAFEGNSHLSVPVLLLTILVLLAPTYYWAPRDTSPVIGIPLDLPAVDPWTGPIKGQADWRPVYPEASGEMQGRYLQAGIALDVYINVYLNQTAGRELIGWDNSVFGERYETVLNMESVVLSYKGGEAFRGQQVLLADSRDNRRVVLYWYLVGKSRTASHWQAKAYQAAWGLVGDHEAGLIAVSSACEGGCSQAIEEVNEFALTVGQALEVTLQAVMGDSDG